MTRLSAFLTAWWDALVHPAQGGRMILDPAGMPGLASVAVIALLFRATAAALGRPLRLAFLVMWGILYAFVGTQLAWVLRPFVGSPEMTYQVFRPRTGNFYESVIHSVNRVIREEVNK